MQYAGLRKQAEFVTTLVQEDHEGEMFWKWFKLQVREGRNPCTQYYPAILHALSRNSIMQTRILASKLCPI